MNQLHLTVESENYDVYGATLLGIPIPLIGFNSKLAWTHTLSTDNRFTLRLLALDPTSPTHYVKDGKSVAMTAVPITINGLAPNGSVVPITRTLYTTEYGPMLMDASFAWGNGTAFAIQDANFSNYQLMDQLLLNGKADSVDSLRQASTTHMALPWVNTIAADSAGATLFGNYSVAANVADAQLLGGCVPGASVGAPFEALMASTGLVVLSGTTSACDWSGRLPAAAKPWVKRSDYVLNTNDSHWWPSLNSFLTGFPKILATGPNAEGQLQNNRTLTGHAQVQDRLSGNDGLAGKRFDMAKLQQVVLKTRFYRAERWLPGFTTACLASTSASAAARDACAVLQAWDKTHGQTSQGAVLFQELYLALGELNAPSWWAVPFDAANPFDTPRDAAGFTAALAQLETLVASTQFDSPQKRRTRPQDVQVLVRADGNIAVPGGAKTFYNWNGVKTEVAPGSFVYTADPLTQAGAAGNSYIQFVTWDSAGPVAEGILTYGQSSNPASPFYSDQTRKYAAGEWIKLPYTEAQIKADASYSVVDIAE
jgi:acyl-homoserine-lactone acylase